MNMAPTRQLFSLDPCTRWSKVHFMRCLWVLVCAVLLHADALAQQNTLAAGGDVAGSTGSVSFSIGQVDFIEVTAATGAVSQGVQQPYIIDITTGHDERSIELSFTAFPNPTRGQLWLSIGGDAPTDLSYRLMDERGRILHGRNITSDMTSIPVEDLAMAVYILQVHNALEVVKTFRIVKQ